MGIISREYYLTLLFKIIIEIVICRRSSPRCRRSSQSPASSQPNRENECLYLKKWSPVQPPNGRAIEHIIISLGRAIIIIISTRLGRVQVDLVANHFILFPPGHIQVLLLIPHCSACFLLFLISAYCFVLVRVVSYSVFVFLILTTRMPQPHADDQNAVYATTNAAVCATAFARLTVAVPAVGNVDGSALRRRFEDK